MGCSSSVDIVNEHNLGTKITQIGDMNIYPLFVDYHQTELFPRVRDSRVYGPENQF